MAEVIEVTDLVIQVVVPPPAPFHVTALDPSAPIIVDITAGGPPGPQGPAGATGPGVPTGGATGEVLAKTSVADFATSWQAAVDPTKLPLAGGTLTGKLNLPASTTTEASIRILPGVAPTTPVNGDVWIGNVAGANQFNWRANGVSYAAVNTIDNQAVNGTKVWGAIQYFNPIANTANIHLGLLVGVPSVNLTNGDMWMTAAGLFARVNGVTIGPLIDAAAVPDEVVGGKITIGAVAPSSPATGDVWIDTN